MRPARRGGRQAPATANANTNPYDGANHSTPAVVGNASPQVPGEGEEMDDEERREESDDDGDDDDDDDTEDAVRMYRGMRPDGGDVTEELDGVDGVGDGDADGEGGIEEGE